MPCATDTSNLKMVHDHKTLLQMQIFAKRTILYRHRWSHEFLNWRAKIKESYFIYICIS